MLATAAIAAAAVVVTRTRKLSRSAKNSLVCAPDEMLGFVVGPSGKGRLEVVPRPTPGPGEALIRVILAGVCNTDLEIMKGYMGFQGIIGHEFVGVVEAFSDVMRPEDVDLVEKFNIGQRVVGDINLCCANVDGGCDTCSQGGDIARNHCPSRTTLGIVNKDGVFAQYITLPLRNLHEVPDTVANEEAVFVEPLAAACRIVEQDLVQQGDKVLVLGDGKLGLLICEVLSRHLGSKEESHHLTLVGKHSAKMQLVQRSASLVLLDSAEYNNLENASFDVVVDVTGSPQGLGDAIRFLRPLGTLVLKSTCAAGSNFHTAPFVIDELKVIGSRCGPFPDALALLDDDADPLHVDKFLTATYDLADIDHAIDAARARDSLKVIVRMS